MWKGRLQPWNSKGWRPEVEAAARDLEGFKNFKCLKPGKRMPQRRVLRVWRLASGRVWRLANGRLERRNNRGLCAGKGHANAGTAKFDGQRAWWNLPRGIWMVLRVWRVWSLANGRLERKNNRGLCAGKGQAATLEWRVLRVLRLANGRLERPNNRGYVHQTAGCNAGTAEAYSHRAWWKPWTMWRPWPWQSRLHTSGGPRRRPCLGEGRGRRIWRGRSCSTWMGIHMHIYIYHICI